MIGVGQSPRTLFFDTETQQRKNLWAKTNSLELLVSPYFYIRNTWIKVDRNKHIKTSLFNCMGLHYLAMDIILNVGIINNKKDSYIDIKQLHYFLDHIINEAIDNYWDEHQSTILKSTSKISKVEISI